MNYTSLSEERFKDLIDRYANFTYRLEKVDMEPISVFKPLNQKHLDEIQMIRELSKGFQKKKDDDLKKAAQAAEEAEKAQEEKTKENPESEQKKEE